jgi:biopolymer transport protein TolR
MAMDVGGKRGGTMSSINVTPMADVMIVLLIIFMVTTPMVIAEKVKLPQASNATADKEDDKALVLSLRNTGELLIDDRSVGHYEPALAQVRELTKGDPERPVRIKADRSVPYRWVSKVMAACSGAQQQGVSLATKKMEMGQ